jgi:hypothetical protein
MARREPEDENIQSGPPKDASPSRPRDRGEEGQRRRRRREPESANAVSAIIPYRNALALVGYYLGVFSLIPCIGLALGPVALLLGILGLRHAHKHPEAHGAAHAITAIVLGGLMTLANFGVVAFMVIAMATNR